MRLPRGWATYDLDSQQVAQTETNPVAINTIAPNWGNLGSNFPVTISGSGFGTAPTVSFSGTGITMSAVSSNDTTITGTITIASNAPVGTQNVTVTNTNVNVTSAPASFDVTSSVGPTISGISPAQGLVGTAINVTISGSGFAAGATVDAGPNISVSSVSVASSSQITATFTPTNSAAAGGNQVVTVTAGGLTSNSQNFFNQVPSALGRISEPGQTPNNGRGPLNTGTNITVTDLSGNVYDSATNVCGGYQWFTYVLADQQGNRIQNGTVTLTESFSNVSPTTPSPTLNSVGSASPNLATQVMSDIYGIWDTAPTCPPANLSQSYTQTWTATVGTTVYNLTTVIQITRSTNNQGLPTFTSTITTD